MTEDIQTERMSVQQSVQQAVLLTLSGQTQKRGISGHIPQHDNLERSKNGNQTGMKIMKV